MMRREGDKEGKAVEWKGGGECEVGERGGGRGREGQEECKRERGKE